MRFRSILLPAVLALGISQPAWAELRLENIQACYGKFGPARENLTLVPFDEICFCFDIVGVQTDTAGEVQGTLRVQLANAKGQVVLEDDSPIRGTLALGGNRLPGSAAVVAPRSMPPGAYTVTVLVHDTLGGEKATFQRAVRFQADRLAIAAPQFFYDADGKIPAPLHGVVGQRLHFRLKAVNFDTSRGKLDFALTVQTYDGDGRALMAKPLVTPIRSNDAEQVRGATTLSFKGFVVLNQAGDFRLRLTVTDQVSGATDALTLRLTVAPLAAAPLAEPKGALRHQLRLIRSGDWQAVRECVTPRLRDAVTPDLVEEAKKSTAALSVDDLVTEVREDGGTKVARVTTKAGRTLTTLVLTDGRWLADTIWCR